MCLWNVGSGWVGTHTWCHLFRVVQAKFETGMCEMKIFGLKFVVCLGTLVQDGLAHMLFRQSSKQGCEIKILGSEVLWCIFGTLVQGWHTCGAGKVQKRDV